VLGGALAAAGVVLHAGPSVARFSWVAVHGTPALGGMGTPGHVALTFDDGPDPASTPAVLEVLDRLGWTATFFMLGTQARAAPATAREVAEAGHEVAVHGDEHRSMLWRSPRATRDDIVRARDSVAQATGVAPRWFRPPYGALTSSALNAARGAGLRTVLWTAWGRDWRAEATPETVVADVLAGHVDGGTVLLHDADVTSAPGSWRSCVGALPLLAAALAARGLQVGPLGEHGIAGGPGPEAPPGRTAAAA
jgi:peptidoglycan/xylan/chitin deacetylase (PgdA/CDA1 family)